MIYVTGDTHGDRKRLSRMALRKLKEGDTLIICGDFGFMWSGNRSEQRFLRALGKRKYNICFIDGTHENFDLLNDYEISQWNGGKVHKIYGNLYHLLRGQIFEIEGKKIFTMGGGESSDIDIRRDVNAWSKGEIPTQEELLEGAENLEIAGYDMDIIVTHEPPLKVKSFLNLNDDNLMLRVTALNAYFEELSGNCRFKKWYFGSIHTDKYISETHRAVFRDIVNGVTGEKI
ncbi:MAG: metallophosphoesterase [Oscillospiraceae bacterium]|nr:metallophosphoesterase [Oscillospiraceae bacterium]